MKKILSLVLSCSLVLGSFGMAFAAPADVEGTKYEDSVTRLAALKVLKGYEDNTFKPEKTITRAEFAKIMANVTGVGTAAEYAKGQTKFADVAGDHWAAGYINVVSDMGIITGYGDGNFGAEDQVTYAQAITMIVRALGYTPKANAMGGYPGGYLAVAAEKEITDDVNVVSTLAATRGDVAMLVDNALTVELMEQTTYGQYPEYSENPDKTLMTTKLDVDELEGRVIAIPQTDSSLDDDEIIIAIEDEDDKTLSLKLDVEYLPLLGVEVKAWADGDDVFFLDIETDDKDIMFDTIDKIDADKNEIDLLVDGDTYDIDGDVEVYINFEESKVKDIATGSYGYVVLNKKDDVVALNVFDFDIEGDLITEVDGEDITLEGTADLDLGDYDDGVHVYDKAFKTVDVDTMAENTVVSYLTEDDEAWFVVSAETTNGKLETASKTEIEVDGTDIDVRSDMVYSLDNNDDLDDYVGSAENLKDLMEEDVTVVLDLNGYARLVYGDVKETSGLMFALFQMKDSGFDKKMKVINNAGDEVVYEFEDTDDFANVPANTSGLNELVAFELNKDGEVAEGTFMNETMINAHSDYDIVANGACDIDDDGYITKNSKRYYVEDDTVFFNVEDNDGEGLVFADIEDVDVKINTEVIVKDAKGGDLVAVVFKNAGVASKGTNYAIVVREPKFNSDWEVKLDVFGEGEVTYDISGKVDSARKLEYKDGHVISFRLNTDNEISSETVVGSTAEVKEVNGKNFRFNANDWYKVDSEAVIYLLDDDGDSKKKLSYGDIDKEDDVYYILDDDKIVVMAKATDATTTTTPTANLAGIVTYVNSTPNEWAFAVDGKLINLTSSFVLKNATGDILLSGSAILTDSTHKLEKDDKVEVDGTVITRVMTKSEVVKASDKAKAQKELDKVSSSIAIAFSAGGSQTGADLEDEIKAHVEAVVDTNIVTPVVVTFDSGTTYEVALTSKHSTSEIVKKDVTATVADASDDATLSEIRVNGVKLDGFDSLDTEYTVELTSTETVTPTVTATENDANAVSCVIVPAADVTDVTKNETTITVTAEDTSTVTVYTITFTLAP